MKNDLDLVNVFDLDDSILKNQAESYSNADGEDGDEENTDYENEAEEIGGIEEQDLPKFRTLVRGKKNELKSKYGKGHWENHWRRECKTILGVKSCIKVPEIKWVSGWRKQWKKFKKDGGLKQLKEMSKGNIPMTSTSPTSSSSVSTSQSQTMKGYDVGTTKKGSKSPSKLQTSDDSSTSSDNKKILGMPKGVAITVGVVTLLGVGFLVYKKFIAKK